MSLGTLNYELLYQEAGSGIGMKRSLMQRIIVLKMLNQINKVK
jgi:hypothetical protein